MLLAVLAVFHRRLELVAAVWALAAFGDGMAGLCGELLGGPKLPWNRHKTWTGLIACVLYGSATSALALRWTQRAVLDPPWLGTPSGPDWIGPSFFAGRFGVHDLVAGCLAAAVAAAIAESLDLGLDDNVTVPLAGGAVLWAATL